MTPSSSDASFEDIGNPDERRLSSLRKKLAGVPPSPGVYLMKAANGRVIYVGKARNLKKRMVAYFKPLAQLDVKTGVLSKKIASFETLVTGSEKEALLLESNLIKKHKPRYNVVLKDDKRYPSLRLDLNHPYPNLTIVRKTAKDGAQYFGPFASALAVRQSLKFINKTFKLRKCKNREFNTRTRPCLHYQMDACLGPCSLPVARERYVQLVREVILFLNGRTPRLIKKVKKQMEAAARSHEFETAARLRDKMFALEKTLEKQVAVTNDFQDRDVLAIARSDEYALIMMLSIRGGFITGSRDAGLTHTLSTDGELTRTFIQQYYEKTPFIPREILVPTPIEENDLIEEWLSGLKGRKVQILLPKRGNKAKLLALAVRNAQRRQEEYLAQLNSKKEVLVRLQKALRMDDLPRCIECFDNSNIGGTSAVAGMVVFEDGSPSKSLYRKYKIKTVAQPDDYAYMAEVLGRRFRPDSRDGRFPDLLMVDGGKGQLNIAVSIVNDLGLQDRFTVIGIAKKDEHRGETRDKIYLPGRANPVNLEKDPDLLLFLQRIRDEAHRFAIGFHRKHRNKSSLHSELDDIPGIGKKKKAMLLKHYGSVKRIGGASIEELNAHPGINRPVAEAIKKALSPRGERASD